MCGDVTTTVQTKSSITRLPNDCAGIIFQYAPATNISKVCKLWQRQWAHFSPIILKQNWNGLCENAGLLAPFVKPAETNHLLLFKQLKADLKAKVTPITFSAIFESFLGSLSFKDYLEFEFHLGSWREFFLVWGKKDEKVQKCMVQVMSVRRSVNVSNLGWGNTPPLLYKFEKILALKLSNNNLSSPPSPKEMSCLKRLQYLDLRNNPIHKAIQLQFKRTVKEAAPQLRLCEMDDCEFTTRSAVNLQKIWGKLAERLKIEDRSNYNMFYWFFRRYQTPDHLLLFESLDISGLGLTYLPRELYRFKNLTELDIRGTSASLETLKKLAASLPKLQILHTDQGMLPLAKECVIS